MSRAARRAWPGQQYDETGRIAALAEHSLLL